MFLVDTADAKAWQSRRSFLGANAGESMYRCRASWLDGLDDGKELLERLGESSG